jgi:hypothetical protein
MAAAIHSHPDLPNSYDYSKKRYGKYIGDYWWISDKNLPLYLITGNGLLRTAEMNKKGEIKSSIVNNELKGVIK